MKISIEILTDKFIKFNKLMFADKLPLPLFKLSDSTKKSVGFSFNRDMKTQEASQYTIHINSKDQDEFILEDLIIHAMIEYYIVFNNLEDSPSHDEIFRKKWDEINHKLNRHIDDSDKLASLEENFSLSKTQQDELINFTKQELKLEKKKKEHFFCLVDFIDEKFGIVVCSKYNLLSFQEKLINNPIVKNVQMRASYDSYFNLFICRRKLVVSIVPQDDYEKFKISSIGIELDKDNILRLKI